MYTPTYTKARATGRAPSADQAKRFTGALKRPRRMETTTYTMLR